MNLNHKRKFGGRCTDGTFMLETGRDTVLNQSMDFYSSV